MVVLRERPESITLGDHFQAAIIAAAWAVVPMRIVTLAFVALTTDGWGLRNILVPNFLIFVLPQIGMVTIAFLPVGRFVVKILNRKGTWDWRPFVLAGAVLVVSLEMLVSWLFDSWPYHWYLGLVVIVGAHAGWRYYLRLCVGKEVAA